MAQGYAEAEVKINGEPLPKAAIASVQVDLDVDLPDMCMVGISNMEIRFSEQTNPLDEVEVTIASTTADPEVIFRGEVVGLEPIFDVNAESRLVIRAFNKLHRLTRVRRSKTYQGKTDAQIAEVIAGDYHLNAVVSGHAFPHDHILQHNQTDFEFLLERAKRCNYELLCDNENLIFRERRLEQQGQVIVLRLGRESDEEEYSLQRFSARLNSAAPVGAVEVRSWDAKQNKKIVGKATEDDLVKKLGATTGVTWARKFVKESIVHYEHPVDSKEEADAYARSLLEDASLAYITGEARCKGHPRLRPSNLVKIEAEDQRFDGEYYVNAVSHQYRHMAQGGRGGYHTLLRVCRNAEF